MESENNTGNTLQVHGFCDMEDDLRDLNEKAIFFVNIKMSVLHRSVMASMASIAISTEYTDIVGNRVVSNT